MAEGSLAGRRYPLANEAARDWAARNYKRRLKTVQQWKPASVNLALAVLDSFNSYLGLGRPVVRREDLPGRAPRTVSSAAARSPISFPAR